MCDRDAQTALYFGSKCYSRMNLGICGRILLIRFPKVRGGDGGVEGTPLERTAAMERTTVELTTVKLTTAELTIEDLTTVERRSFVFLVNFSAMANLSSLCIVENRITKFRANL